MEGTLAADGPYGSTQSRGVDNRCEGFLSISDTPVDYLQETMSTQWIHGGASMEDLQMSYLILSTVYHQADGPSLYYAGEIITQQDTSGSS